MNVEQIDISKLNRLDDLNKLYRLLDNLFIEVELAGITGDLSQMRAYQEQIKKALPLVERLIVEEDAEKLKTYLKNLSKGSKNGI